MIRVLTAEQLQAAETRAVADGGCTIDVLMERAGAAIAEEVAERAPEGRVLVLAGSGNNGGDGWVAARILQARGREAAVISFGDPSSLAGAALEAHRRAAGAGVRWTRAGLLPDAAAIAEYRVIVDALLGIGASGPPREPYPAWIDAVNASGALVVSADVPTGVDSDSGDVLGPAVAADLTVTFSALKPGLVQYPGRAHAGEIVVVDVGIPDALLDVTGTPEVWEQADFRRLLPRPSPDTHKDARGRVLVVAGSAAYPGAAVLAVRGAQRAGAGYVTLACPEPVVPTAHAHLVAAPVVGMPASGGRAFASRALDRILALAADHDAVVLGPGLTLADGAVVVARGLVSRLDRPLVVDADGLNALVDAVDLLDLRRAPTVLTPHPGEMGRLLGIPSTDVQRDRFAASSWLATDSRAVVLKGAGTVVSGLGRQVVITAGSSALATAGTGDVLAGMTGALLAQGLDPLEAGVLSAWWHAKAGERAASELTLLGMTAEDLPDYLPRTAAELLWS